MKRVGHFAPKNCAQLSLLGLFGRVGLVMLASIFLGLVIPGVVAWRDGVFFHSTTVQLASAKKSVVRDGLERDKNKRDQLENAISAIDRTVTSNANFTPQLIAQRDQYKAELKRISPSVSVQEFYLHLIMYFWPIMYFGLGTVAFMLRPNSGRSMRFWKMPFMTFVTSVFIYAYIMAPFLFRTQIGRLHDEPRRVFAYSNPDIDLPSHIVQLANFYVMAFVLAIIWIEWSKWNSEDHDQSLAINSKTDSVDASALIDLSRDLMRWQMSFILVSAGFVTYTAIFWDQMIINHDRRFGLEAVDIHLLWLATVVFISGPLAKTWQRWHTQKITAVAELVNSGLDADLINAKLSALQELQPIGRWNLTASGIAVIGSFAAPLLQAILKKALLGDAGH